MRFCKDCKHSITNNESLFNIWKCKKGIKKNTCLVTGEVSCDGAVSCQKRRMENGDCGPEGKLFEPKETENIKVDNVLKSEGMDHNIDRAEKVEARVKELEREFSEFKAWFNATEDESE